MNQSAIKNKNLHSNLCIDQWNETKAGKLSAIELLQYRSNLLGSDKKITNFGGGNTSAKIFEMDSLTGKQVEVLWVKGSGGDLGSMQLNGFSSLYMEKLEKLKDVFGANQDEDSMVSYLPHCTFNLNPRVASIDTALHAFLPYKHVDHMHPDSIIAIAAAKNGAALTDKIFSGDIGWLSWRRPGFILGLELEKFVKQNPHAKGVILESHGLFTWADDALECYQLTIKVINQAQCWLDKALDKLDVFNGPLYQSLESKQRQKFATSIMPVIRGLISEEVYMVADFVDNETVLEFVNSNAFSKLAAMGTSCPDHFLRTKICPLVIEVNPAKIDLAVIKLALPDLLSSYRKHYQAYYDRCKNTSSPSLRNPNPVIFLIPGVGMIAFAKDKATARIAGEFYINAINVMKVAEAISEYVALPEQEAFDIEYWLLEEAKLKRMPEPRALAGQIALITGAAGGIGQAVARKLLEQGSCVFLTDIDNASLNSVTAELAQDFSQDVVFSLTADITSETQVIALVEKCCSVFGGVDLLVSNAGIASSAPIEETSLELWQKNMDVLSTGYFLISREVFKVYQQQLLAGAVVFVASKNALVASPNAAAYCTAKAAEIQLARSLALEGAGIGIRVNVVNPDAVLQGSKIWNGEWKKQRADAYKMDPDDLQEYYRNRSLLKRNVYPEDIASAVFFLVSKQSDKSTGNIINVDAGHAPSFTR